MSLTAATPQSYIDELDAEDAIRFLERNKRNRALSERHVNRLLREMTSGKWQFNGESIKFAADGSLLDGQHRLAALAKTKGSGIRIPFAIIMGLPSTSQVTMDQGKKRSTADQLVLSNAMDNTVHSRAIAASVKLYLEWERGLLFGDKNLIENEVAQLEVVEWCDQNRAEVARMQELYDYRLRYIKVPPSVSLAIYYKLSTIDLNAAQEFFTKLSRGTDLSDGSPILALRDRLDVRYTTNGQAISHGPKLSRNEQIGLFVYAWNAFRDGRSLTLLKRPINGYTADNFPVPH